MKPVVGSTASFSNTKPSRSYQRQALIFTRAAQPDFVRKPRPRESKQLTSEIAALVVRCHEQLVEIAFAKMQCEHHGELSFVRDEEAPSRFRFPSAPARATSPAGSCWPVRDRSKPSSPSRLARLRHIRRAARGGSGAAAWMPFEGLLPIFAILPDRCNAPIGVNKRAALRAALRLVVRRKIRRDRIDPRSLPWSRPRRNPSRISPWHPQPHRPRRKR